MLPHNQAFDEVRISHLSSCYSLLCFTSDTYRYILYGMLMLAISILVEYYIEIFPELCHMYYMFYVLLYLYIKHFLVCSYYYADGKIINITNECIHV